MPLLAITTNLAKEARGYGNLRPRNALWDVDSKVLGIDNRASAFISGDIDNFVGPHQDTNRVIKTFGGGRTTNVQVGMARVQLKDDSS
jgi:hypothetical protein